MDISKAIAQMKKVPGFADNVGIVLVHNSVVRACSAEDKSEVVAFEIRPDQSKLQDLREEYVKREGIFDIEILAKHGRFRPGDDLMFVIVAGDSRDNVNRVLSELIERIESEAVVKREIRADE